MFSLRILFGGAERLRGHLCICCFGSSGMWSVGLETVPSDRPAAPREALPGGSDAFKGGRGSAGLPAGRRQRSRSGFNSLFFLFSFVSFFLSFSSQISFHTLLFFGVFFFFLFSFSPRVFLLLSSQFSFLLDGDGGQMFRPARRLTYSDEVGV